MNPGNFEYDPLESVFRAMESETEMLDTDALKESLRARGLHPDETIASVKSKVEAFLKGQQPSWQELARQKQARFDAVTKSIVSWIKRRPEEIEEAFAKVSSGAYGVAAQMRLQTAWRNVSSIPLEDKATFLDELDILQQLRDNANKGDVGK
jgi:hypothetical protein